ncbi:hypothetical protein NEOLEDRAFT_1042684, partial [Neolentinus lepideus HHB14362 ss-1]
HEAQLCSTLLFVGTSNEPDPTAHEMLKPDISVYSNTTSDHDRTSWEHVDLCVGLKSSMEDDPFWASDSLHSRVVHKQGNPNQGQLVDYANFQWEYQHHAFLFQVSIFKDFARLLRYDRSGVIVSTRFKYQETPYLAQFLSR